MASRKNGGENKRQWIETVSARNSAIKGSLEVGMDMEREVEGRERFYICANTYIYIYLY